MKKGVSKNVIPRIKKPVEDGNSAQQYSSGRGRIFTTLQDDPFVFLGVKRNKNVPSCQIAAHLAISTGSYVSAKSISRR